jgi:hypothetical protein
LFAVFFLMGLSLSLRGLLPNTPYQKSVLTLLYSLWTASPSNFHSANLSRIFDPLRGQLRCSSQVASFQFYTFFLGLKIPGVALRT